MRLPCPGFGGALTCRAMGALSTPWGGARAMAADPHEALIRAYIDELFNGHRVDALDKYWEDDLTSHWLGMETIHGLPAWRAAMDGFFAAFPDAAFPDAAYTLDDMFFAGD